MLNYLCHARSIGSKPVYGVQQTLQVGRYLILMNSFDNSRIGERYSKVLMQMRPKCTKYRLARNDG